jgi:hypothetical protein
LIFLIKKSNYCLSEGDSSMFIVPSSQICLTVNLKFLKCYCLIVTSPLYWWWYVILQGALRDLSKRHHEPSIVPAEHVFSFVLLIFWLLLISIIICAAFHPNFFACDDQVDQGNSSDCGTATIPSHNNLAAFSENNNQALAADR